MKKAIALTVMLVGFLGNAAMAQEIREKIYNPEANAKNELNLAVEKAKMEGKNVLVQVGGNWCSWCLRMHKFMAEDPELKKTLAESYVFALVNYSKENKNLDVLEELGNPQKFGFPVFVVLNGSGKAIHIQNTAELEEGKSYSKEKLLTFLKSWSAEAVSSRDK